MQSDSQTQRPALRPAAFQTDALLTEIDAADFLRLSARTLQAWRCRGEGPAYVQAGRAIRYRRRELSAWVEANLVTPDGGRR